MFWNNLKWYCKLYDITPNGLCQKLDFSNATATQWKHGAIPEKNNLQKIADYFNITVEELLNDDVQHDTYILRAYHSATPAIRQAVNRLLGIEEQITFITINTDKITPDKERSATAK